MVNSVSFGRKGVFDKAEVEKPQANTRTNTATAETKPDEVVVGGKKHTAAKVIGGTVATVAVAAGLLAAGKHFGAFNVEKVADLTKSFKDQKWISWAKKPVKATLNGLDKAGEYILKKGKAVGEWFKNIGKKSEKPAETKPVAEPAPAAPAPAAPAAPAEPPVA